MSTSHKRPQRASVTVRIAISMDERTDTDISATGGYEIDEFYTRENAIADTVLAAMRGFAAIEGCAGYGRPEWLLQDCLKREGGDLTPTIRDEEG